MRNEERQATGMRSERTGASRTTVAHKPRNSVLSLISERSEVVAGDGAPFDDVFKLDSICDSICRRDLISSIGEQITVCAMPATCTPASVCM